MTIYKISKYPQKLSSVLWDKNLSLDARGLYAVLIDMFPDQEFTEEKAIESSGEEAGLVKTALAELNQAGYIDKKSRA